MDSPTPPKPVRLELGLFPKEPWAKPLVDAINQLSLQTTQATTRKGVTYKVLTFKTPASAADAFPIDIKVDAPVTDVRVALVLSGAPNGAVTVTAQMLSGGKLLRVSNITGLAANTAYSVRLAME